MCGHGTIGLVVTLAHLGRLARGHHRIDTPVGTVSVELRADGRVTVGNVPSYRWAKAAVVDVPGHGSVEGDVAWGGNWFFLVRGHGLELSADRAPALTDFAERVRQALLRAGITSADGAEVDHVELFAPSPASGAESTLFIDQADAFGWGILRPAGWPGTS